MPIRNIGLNLRALLSFGIICLLLAGVGTNAVFKMNGLHQSADQLQTDWLPSVRQAGRIETAGLLYRLDARRFVMDDQRQSPESVNKLNGLKNALLQTADTYGSLVSSPQEEQVWKQVKADALAYSEKIDQLVELSKSKSDSELFVFIRDITSPQAKALQSSIEQLIEVNVKGAEQSGAIADKNYESGLTVTLTLIVLAVIITLIVATLFTRSIARPVQALLDSTRKIAEGDLRTTVEVNGADELTELQKATATMLSSLKGTIQHISDASGLLASAAEEMSSITQDSAQGIQRQTMETEQAATAVNQMTAAIEEVARNAVAASTSTQACEKSAQTGQDCVGQTIAALEKLSTTVDKTGVEVEGLAHQAQDIDRPLTKGTDRNVLEQQVAPFADRRCHHEQHRRHDIHRPFDVVAHAIRRPAANLTMVARRCIDPGTTGQNSAEVLPGCASAGEHILQLCTIASVYRIAQGIEIRTKAVQRAQYCLPIGHEDVVPHGRIAACNTREITETASGIPEYVQVFITLGQ
ncbi:putative methyl-accepting chemotaxis protein [Pseudomonas syringae pv. cunninghamiae]|nr:putative methyl-accepting chemotaxis protein [Pseudomonas syringae pv. cunninghamiae]